MRPLLLAALACVSALAGCCGPKCQYLAGAECPAGQFCLSNGCELVCGGPDDPDAGCPAGKSCVANTEQCTCGQFGPCNCPGFPAFVCH